jgi:membrane protease YdiL (CAAX protease family)
MTQTNQQTRKEIFYFLAGTFSLSVIFYVLIFNAGSILAQGGLYVFGLMWTPGLTAILLSLLFKKSHELGWRPGKPSHLITAYFLPIAYSLPVYILVWLTGLGGFDRANAPGAIQLGIFAVVYVFMGLVSGLGEEIGWRGFLVPRLTKMMGFTRATLLVGIIWVAWHTPLILFSDYDTGATPSAYALFCFFIMVMGVSFAFSYLRMASGSLWPAALLHAAHNAYIQGLFDPLTINTGTTAWWIGEFGAGLAVTGLLVGLIFWRKGRKLAVPLAS